MLNLSAGDKLGSFLRQFPDFPNAFLIGGAADIFVTELADQVRAGSLTSQAVSLFFLYVFSFALIMSASKTKSGASVVALSLPIEGPSR